MVRPPTANPVGFEFEDLMVVVGHEQNWRDLTITAVLMPPDRPMDEIELTVWYATKFVELQKRAKLAGLAWADTPGLVLGGGHTAMKATVHLTFSRPSLVGGYWPLD